MLTPELLPKIQRLLADAGLDGWLLYDFRGTNAIAHGLLGFDGLVSPEPRTQAKPCKTPFRCLSIP